MAKYIDADLLREEIKSIEEDARKVRVAEESTMNQKIGADGQVHLCQKLNLLIDSLQEEQPEVDLEKELDSYYDSPQTEGDVVSWMVYTRIARHFAEWGYLRAAEKYNEIEYNRQRAEEFVPNDLEEAANKFAVFYDQGTCDGIAQECFIAGAKWDREQMMKDGNVILAEEDFEAEKEKSMEWGYNLCKEQMMKDAVEGEIQMRYSGSLCAKTIRAINEDKFKFGDKVRVIVLPKED